MVFIPGHNTSLLQPWTTPPPPGTRSQHLPPSPPGPGHNTSLPPFPPGTRSQHFPPPPPYAQAGGTHPTGMHSCLTKQFRRKVHEIGRIGPREGRASQVPPPLPSNPPMLVLILCNLK